MAFTEDQLTIITTQAWMITKVDEQTNHHDGTEVQQRQRARLFAEYELANHYQPLMANHQAYIRALQDAYVILKREQQKEGRRDD